MRTKFKAWAEPYIKEHPEIGIEEENYPSIKDCYLEIGCGKGGFLIDMSTKFSDKTFIGVEKNVTCAGISAKKVVESKLPNAKLLWVDADKLVKVMKDDSIDGIFLNFSDPWPKKKHHKRRLTAPSFINEYYRIIKTGGFLAFKTDNKDLFDFTVEMVQASRFDVKSINYDYKDEDEFDSITEYEANFRSQGLPIYRIVLGK